MPHKIFLEKIDDFCSFKILVDIDFSFRIASLGSQTHVSKDLVVESMSQR